MKKWGARLISPQESTNLMLLPWLHFGMLNTGVFDAEYLFTLAGLFNIAGSMANLKRKIELEQQFSDVQKVMAELIASARCPDVEESQKIALALGAADRYLSRQTKADLARVIAYVDQCIASGKAIRPVVSARSEQ